MNGTDIAALIAAFGGLSGGIFAGVRALRSDKINAAAQQAAGLLSGLQGLITTLQAEVTRLTSSLEQTRASCDKERTAWDTERKSIRKEHIQEMREAYERMDELGSQLYVVLNRPLESKTRTTDKRKS